MNIISVPIFTYPTARIRAPDTTGSVTLDAAEEFLVMVMRVPKSGTLNKITWRTGTITGSSYTLKISVETVASSIGEPVATTNATKTLYATGAESADITSLSSGTVYHTPINGSTGISVAAGDLIAITFRLTAVDTSSIIIAANIYEDNGRLFCLNYPGDVYQRLYLSGSWSTSYATPPLVSLQYSDGFTPVIYSSPPCIESKISWNSRSNPDRRGIKFKFPAACRLYGLMMSLGLDTTTNVILYDSDEYSIITGFPISLSSSQRRNYNQAEYIVVFPTRPEISADTWYRLVLLPTTDTSIGLTVATLPDDGTTLGIGASLEGANLVYTYRNGTPSSGDHTWTDSNDKPAMTLLVDGIDSGSGGGSGISRSRQVMG